MAYTRAVAYFNVFSLKNNCHAGTPPVSAAKQVTMMTFSHRLFLSDVLKFIMIAALWVCMAVIARAALMAFSVDGLVDAGLIRAKALEVGRWADTLATPGQEGRLAEKINSFNAGYAEKGFAVFAFKAGRRLAGPDDANILAAVPSPLLKTEGEKFLIDDSNVYFSVARGDYRLLLVNDRFSIRHSNGVTDDVLIIFAIFFMVLTLAITLNGLMTRRMIVKPAMAALNALRGGITEIREGNLNYRLRYPAGKEFYDICRMFNEMADRLLKSDDQMRRDEESRLCLIAGISHDLRGPLSSIRAYAQGVLAGAARTKADEEEYLKIIIARTDSIERVVRQLSMFSRLDLFNYPLTFKLCDFDEELKKLVAQGRAAYELAGLDFSLDLNAGAAFVNLDLPLFQIVLSNIFDNSLKYRDKDRALMKISTRVDPVAEAPRVRIQPPEAADGQTSPRFGRRALCLTLSDDGPGVPEEKLGWLFDMFFRADTGDARTGRSLGLAISAKIISRLGGAINAKNAPGGGLSIEITLPVIQPAW